MTRPKQTIPLLEGLTKSHLVSLLRFYGRFKILQVFVVLIWAVCTAPLSLNLGAGWWPGRQSAKTSPLQLLHSAGKGELWTVVPQHIGPQGSGCGHR